MSIYLQIVLSSLIAGTLDTVAGIGGGLLLLPVLVMVAGGGNTSDAVVLAAIIPIGWNLPKLIMLRDWVNWRSTGLMTAGIIPGTLIGAHYLGAVNPDLLRVAIGVLLIFSGLYYVLRLYVDLPKPPPLSATMFPIVGFFTGIIGAVLGAGHGPLQTGALAASGMPVREVSATGGALGMVMALSRLFGYAVSGVISSDLFMPAAVGMAAACAGAFLGINLSRRSKDSTLELLIAGVLVAAGIKMLW